MSSALCKRPGLSALAFAACLAQSGAFAQEPAPAPMAGHSAMHGAMSHAQTPSPAGMPTEVGQGAFAAIGEIVALLAADPDTDWSKVDIDALRQHLVDMNAVTLQARAARTPVDGGLRFDVTGDGPVADSIRRMVLAHAAMMNGVDGWSLEAASIPGGASLIVRAPAKDAAKVEGLGFFGILALGMHHQMHHLMLARGKSF